MSLISGSINESEQAGEKLADHITDHIGQDAPNILERILDVLAKFRLRGSFDIGLEKKQ